MDKRSITHIGAGNGSGFHINYVSGYTLSVQWDRMHHAARIMDNSIDTFRKPTDELSASTVELVVIGPDGIWCDFDIGNEKTINYFPVTHLHRVMQYVSTGDTDELWAFLHRWWDDELAQDAIARG